MLPGIRRHDDCDNAILEFSYTDSFENKTSVKIELFDDTIGSLFEGIKHAVLGCGFSLDDVNEWFPEEQ